MVSFPSVVSPVVVDRFNDERLRRKEQALCAAYLSLKNRELQVNYETVVNLIGATKTRKGLQIKARLDRRSYEKGKKVPDEIIDNLEIEYHRIVPANRCGY